MEWIKADVQTTPLGAEIVTGILLGHGIFGVEIINSAERVRHLKESAQFWDYADEKLFDVGDGVYVVFYVTKDASGERLLEDVKISILQLREDSSFSKEGIGSLEVKIRAANDEAWLHEWKKHFKPLRVGKVLIVPEWEKEGAWGRSPHCDDIIFTIDPGSAFGTGQHQTTQMCISALQKFVKPGGTILDIGCGSGILSVISLLLGAGEVFACDIDPAGAIAATKKNAALNSIDINRLQIHAGDALSDNALRQKICAKKYDVAVANIVADVVIELIPLVEKLLAPGGIFIASGIIDERLPEVLSCLDKNNFFASRTVQVQKKEGWCCVHV